MKKESLKLLFSTFGDTLSPHIAFVITHCEDIVKSKEAEYLQKLKSSISVADVISKAGLGIILVGFPQLVASDENDEEEQMQMEVNKLKINNGRRKLLDTIAKADKSVHRDKVQIIQDEKNNEKSKNKWQMAIGGLVVASVAGGIGVGVGKITCGDVKINL